MFIRDRYAADVAKLGCIRVDWVSIPSKPPSIGGLLDVVYDAYIGNMLTVLGEYLRFVVVRVYCGVHTQA